MFYVLDAKHLLLTVKEGGNVISDWGENKSDKTIFIFGKTTFHLQCRVSPCVYMEEKGDIPYCTYRFNCNIIVLTVVSLNTQIAVP